MKVTVFGAIGRLVVDDLLQAGHDVVAYVRNADKVPPHWPTDRVDIVVGAITDPAARARRRIASHVRQRLTSARQHAC